MKELLIEFLTFLKSPDRHSFSQSPFRDQVVEVTKIFVITFAAVILIAVPLMTLIGADDLPNKLSELENLGFDKVWQQNLALFTLAVIAVPLLEEVLFRFPLKFRRGAIALSLVLIGTLAANILQVFGVDIVQATTIGVGLVVLLAVILYLFLRGDGQLDAFTNKYFIYFFYAAALLFAFAHVFNYELRPDQKWMTPILVLPQMILGLMLGYLRIKYGLWAAIMAHAMNNMIPTLALIFMPEEGFQ
jgi:membrane protease YdiL (CAAX protease family)